MVKLSVIVPFFNVQPFVPDALRSLRANARHDFEFLLMDDGSTDRTPQLLEEGAGSLPGARIIRRDHTGVAALRNAGIDEARGEYLTFMDGDDWLAPGYLPQLVRAMDELDVDFLRTDHVQCTGSSRNVIRAPHGRRNARIDPRAAILPADRPTLVDYPYSWAAPTTAGSSSRAWCTCPRTCAPPRTGRGSGGCTGRPGPARWWACWACTTGAG